MPIGKKIQVNKMLATYLHLVILDLIVKKYYLQYEDLSILIQSSKIFLLLKIDSLSFYFYKDLVLFFSINFNII